MLPAQLCRSNGARRSIFPERASFRCTARYMEGRRCHDTHSLWPCYRRFSEAALVPYSESRSGPGRSLVARMRLWPQTLRTSMSQILRKSRRISYGGRAPVFPAFCPCFLPQSTGRVNAPILLLRYPFNPLISRLFAYDAVPQQSSRGMLDFPTCELSDAVYPPITCTICEFRSRPACRRATKRWQQSTAARTAVSAPDRAVGIGGGSRFP